MRKLLYVCGIILFMGMVACSSDKDNEEGYNMNDIVGKWECYKYAEIIKGTDSKEIVNEKEFPFKNWQGLDSTWVETFNIDGSYQTSQNGNKVSGIRFEVRGEMLIYSDGSKLHIDELTHERMRLRYTFESRKGVFTQLIYRRVE